MGCRGARSERRDRRGGTQVHAAGSRGMVVSTGKGPGRRDDRAVFLWSLGRSRAPLRLPRPRSLPTPRGCHRDRSGLDSRARGGGPWHGQQLQWLDPSDQSTKILLVKIFGDEWVPVSELPNIPVLLAFIEDNDIQEIRIVSTNMGFTKTIRKAFKKQKDV